MARGRMLNNSISCSLKFDLLPDDTCRLLATWTISHLDCHGVFHADPGIVKSLVFTRRDDITTGQIDEYLQAMIEVGLIVLFKTSDGQQWQYWPGFSTNQVGLRAEREKTNYPMPPTIRQDDGKMPDKIRQDDGKKPAEVNLSEDESESKGKEHDEDAALALPNSNLAVEDTALEDAMGPRQHFIPKGEIIQSSGDWAARLQNNPHLTWGSESQEIQRQVERYGSTASPILRLGYELEQALGIRPAWNNRQEVKTWTSGLVECLENADHDWQLVVRVARQMREEGLSIKNPHSVKGMVADGAAKKRSKTKEYQRAQRCMAEDPQREAGRQLMEIQRRGQ